MSCGFSSEYSANTGSTMLNAGSVPGVGIGEELVGAADVQQVLGAMPSGYRPAVN